MKQIRKYYMGLLVGILVSLILPLIIASLFPWPQGTTQGTVYAITVIAILLFLGIWGIFYQKVRALEPDYLTRKNKLGIAILILVIFACIATAIGNFLILQTETVADFTFAEAWYYPAYTRFNLTLAQLYTQFGRFLGVVLFQLMIILVFVGCALGVRPKHENENPNQDLKNGTIFLGISIVIVVVISILAALGLGYVWVGTEGRFYLIEGFYPEHFTILLIPNVFFILFGPAFFMLVRKNFKSEIENGINRVVMKRYIISGIVIFNLLFASHRVIPELVLNDTALSYFLFLFLQSLLSTAVILMIEANRAKMGEQLTFRFRFGSFLYFFGMIGAAIGYILMFPLFGVAIYTELSEIMAYFPNLIFGGILTAGLYYLGLFLETKIKREVA